MINFLVQQIKDIDSFFVFPYFAKCLITEAQQGRSYLALTQVSFR